MRRPRCGWTPQSSGRTLSSSITALAATYRQSGLVQWHLRAEPRVSWFVRTWKHAVLLPSNGSPMVQGRDVIEGVATWRVQSLGGEDLTVKTAVPAGNDAIVAIVDWTITLGQ